MPHLDRAVVIAGAGPTGLMLAAELALARVDVAVVERRATQDLAGTRAGGLHARTLEVLDQRGVVERFLAAGRVMQVNGFGSISLDLAGTPTRHPYGLALSQNHIERLLAAWVDELGVPVHRGVDVAGFTQDDDHVAIALADGRVLRAAYLVGCDGGRSVVRKQAGIDFAGWDASTSYLLAEVATTEPVAAGFHRTPRGTHALGPMDDGRHVRMVLEEPAVGSGDAPDLDELRALLRASFGTDFGVHDPIWLTRFSDAARQAVTYRDRRVLLAGDAAHVHSPVGGQGLNTGVQDAVNLGWKLAQVVHGTSAPALLDSYHAERHPVGARVLRVTMAQTALRRGDDRTVALVESVGELLRMDEPRRRFGAMMAGLDHHYHLGAGHPLLGRRMPDLELATAGGPRRVSTFLHAARPVLIGFGAPVDPGPWAARVPAIEARYDGAWELPGLGAIAAPAAVLVRPDGHVAWVGDGSDDGLAAALTTWFGDPSAQRDQRAR